MKILDDNGYKYHMKFPNFFEIINFDTHKYENISCIRCKYSVVSEDKYDICIYLKGGFYPSINVGFADNSGVCGYGIYVDSVLPDNNPDKYHLRKINLLPNELLGELEKFQPEGEYIKG